MIMKTTALSLLFTIGAALSQADAASLIYGFDFDLLGDSDNTLTNLGTGTTSITKTAYLNYTPQGPIGPSTGKSHNPKTGTFKIVSSSGIGLDTATGFSIGMHVYNAGANWADLFSIGVNNQLIKFERNGSTNKLVVYSMTATDGQSSYTQTGFTNGGDTGFAIGSNTWTYLGITVQDNIWTFYQTTASGTTLLGTLDAGTTFTGNVTFLKGGGTQGDNLYMDNFAAYDGVLTANDFTYLAANPMPVTIPEPATCTLSLLGLAALAARRKRN